MKTTRKKPKPLARIARKARYAAVLDAMQRFGDNRQAVAAYFDLTPQAIGMILARK